MSTKIQIREADKTLLNDEALAWSLSNPARDLIGVQLKRFAGCLGWARLDRAGFPYGSKELVVHVEARSHYDAITRIKAALDVLAPELTQQERLENSALYNVYSEDEHPAFVLRGVIGEGMDHEILDGDAVWLFSGGIWPGLHALNQRPQFIPVSLAA